MKWCSDCGRRILGNASDEMPDSEASGELITIAHSAELVALLRGAEGPVRSRIIRALAITGAAAAAGVAATASGATTSAIGSGSPVMYAQASTPSGRPTHGASIQTRVMFRSLLFIL